jgi:hypothetical protein
VRTVKRIHIYLGLLNLVMLLIFGIAGLTAFFHRLSGPAEPAVTSEYFVSFTPSPNSTDRQISDSVAPVLRAEGCFVPGSPHDAAGNLRLTCYSANGLSRVTVLEAENRLFVQHSRNSVWGYLGNLHAALPRESSAKRYLTHRLWSYYVEFSVWSLTAMCLSGIYLWLATRPRQGLAWCVFAGGSVTFAVLWFLGS